MKKNCISTLIKGGWICGCIICMASCGPVHRFMRIKNVPREYMRNYSIEGVKAPRSQTLPKHTPWIVFANEAGTSYLSPSGKNEMQSVKYMDAFLVIKRKGDWLRVIQYDPAILKNGKLKEWKQAKYCGWINQNDLLLTRSGFTDIVTGFKNKQVVMLNDSVALATPKNVFCQRLRKTVQKYRPDTRGWQDSILQCRISLSNIGRQRMHPRGRQAAA